MITVIDLRRNNLSIIWDVRHATTFSNAKDHKIQLCLEEWWIFVIVMVKKYFLKNYFFMIFYKKKIYLVKTVIEIKIF